jgi:hypothetical protein
MLAARSGGLATCWTNLHMLFGDDRGVRMTGTLRLPVARQTKRRALGVRRDLDLACCEID